MNIKTMLKDVCLAVLTTIVFSCTPGELETYPSLGDGYYLIGNDSASSAIVKEGDNKGRGYSILILGQVKRYNYDKKFIIVYRNASEEAKLFYFDNPLWQEQRGKDSLQYWIIKKSDNKIFGPLNKLGYQRKRDSLKISKSISLAGDYYTP